MIRILLAKGISEDERAWLNANLPHWCLRFEDTYNGRRYYIELNKYQALLFKIHFPDHVGGEMEV